MSKITLVLKARDKNGNLVQGAKPLVIVGNGAALAKAIARFSPKHKKDLNNEYAGGSSKSP